MNKRLLKRIVRKFNFSKNEILSNTYSDTELVKAIVRKNKKYLEEVVENNTISLSGLRTFVPFALGEFGRDVEVLDFGGGGGKHYFEAKAGMPTKRFKWTILETAEMASECRLTINSTPELTFIDDLTELIDSKLDLVVANSSLQYTEDPINQLKRILSLESRYIFITRTVLSETNLVDFYQHSRIQDNGPSLFNVESDERRVSYRVIAPSKLQFEETLSEKYTIKLKIVEEKGIYKSNDQLLNVYGYFCARK